MINFYLFVNVFSSWIVSFGFQETGFILLKTKNDFEKLDGVLTPSFPRIEKERATALASVAIHLLSFFVCFLFHLLPFFYLKKNETGSILRLRGTKVSLM